jgi:glucosamine kinase
MTLYLAIDGGGTGCRALIADAAGTVMGTATAGPANIATDATGARANILSAARAALGHAIGVARIEAELPKLIAGLGLAGANAAGAAGRLRLALPFARSRIETDVIAAVKGALGTDDGIVAALGTGSVFAVQQGGAIRQIGGWGFVLGDEGSGAFLGRAILSLALRATDGFATMTPFLQALITELGGPAGVVAFAQGRGPAEFAALAPRILASDDPAAQVLLRAALADVAAAIDLLQAKPPMPVVFMGGIGQHYATRLAGRWPIIPARGTPLDGALILAREAA